MEMKDDTHENEGSYKEFMRGCVTPRPTLLLFTQTDSLHHGSVDGPAQGGWGMGRGVLVQRAQYKEWANGQPVQSDDDSDVESNRRPSASDPSPVSEVRI
eukprot:1658648-Rhodomonas_salina.4